MHDYQSVTSEGVAKVLFALIKGANLDAADRNQAAAYFAQTGAPVDYRSFQRFTDALILSLPQQHELLQLVPQWQSIFNRSEVSNEMAEEFIRQYLVALDNKLFVKLPLFVGRFAGQDSHAINFAGFGNTQVDSWLLVFTISGKGHLKAGLRDYELTPDNIALVAPGTLTDFSGSEHSSWNFYWVVFQCADNWRPYLQWPQSGPGVCQLEGASESFAPVERNLSQLYNNYVESGPLKMELDHNLLEQLLLRCAACLPRESNRKMDPRVHVARAYIDEHYTADIVLADVAAASNISSSRLSGLFKKETGSSVMAYRNELRLVKAAQLLLHSNLRIADIGDRVGYSEQAFFSRIFRKHLGMSPRQYRTHIPAQTAQLNPHS
ncbi:MAG: helix-turn-helix domain-containing protein [Halioglobus sp.]|jgi:AraC family transcriptional regulator of arabinose operon|tara:strand:+ start:3931 stop:5067 length:1137 start_codon:yes stop_codon:yes gene_type:complete